jgi:hypothetical protein
MRQGSQLCVAGGEGEVEDALEEFDLGIDLPELWSALTRMFQSDVEDGERGVFFDVVAGNLRAGVQYEYLLCGSEDYWRPHVAVYRELLSTAGLPFEVTHDCLHFRVIDFEVPAAVCILDLDIPRLQRMEPILWERQRHSVSEDGRWSYISVERHGAQGGVVIEPG